jgi:RecA/RadA recombinase
MAEEQSHPGMPSIIPDEARQHMRAARMEMHRSLKALFPPAFVEHRRAARREVLLAARSLLDHALEGMAREDKA